MSTTLANFDSFFQELKNSILNDFQEEPLIKATLERFEKVLSKLVHKNQ